MAKDKDRQINPALAAHKAAKAKSIKKGKAAVLAQRNERLAKRNPDRLQRQIDDFRAAEQAGTLQSHERQQLQKLEADVKSIRKAREALGERAPQFGRERGGRDRGEGGEGQGILGKRRRDGHRGLQRRWEESDSSDTDPDVRDIPMPRDTPPPIPRRPRPSNANQVPLGSGRPEGGHALPPKPVSQAPAQTVYESAPVIRDLLKESTSRFVPAAVQRKVGLAKGTEGRLAEPEELDKLEREGYLPGSHDLRKPAELGTVDARTEIGVQESRKIEKDELREEVEKFESELRHVSIEEVPDEDL